MSRTDDEIAKLDADGVPADQLVETWYFFIHFGATTAARKAFRDALQAAGFTNLGADTEGPDPHYLHYWSHMVRIANRDALREADHLARTIAQAHGVRYDEWEVARDSNTGELRPVEPRNDATPLGDTH